jgi:hypothetical protein
MKRKLLMPLVIVALLAVIGGGGFYGYPQFIRLQQLESEFAALREEKNKLEQQASAVAVEIDGKTQQVAGLEQKARELDAARAALSSGVAVAILEAAVKSSKAPTAEQYLAIGAVRMIANGGADKEAAAAYERALQLANWPAAMKLACAAQSGIAATGRTVEISKDCGRMLTAGEAAPAAAAGSPAAGQDGANAGAPAAR